MPVLGTEIRKIFQRTKKLRTWMVRIYVITGRRWIGSSYIQGAGERGDMGEAVHRSSNKLWRSTSIPKYVLYSYISLVLLGRGWRGRISMLGRKYHYDWMYAIKWPSPVHCAVLTYVVCGYVEHPPNLTPTADTE